MIASVMLVAVASFVLHGSAMATAMAAGSAVRTVQADHQSHGDGTVHAPSAAHAAVDQAGDGSGDAPVRHGPQGDCCGLCCQTVVVPVLLPFVLNRVGVSSIPPAFSVHGRGIAHEGLRRPPRPADIA